MKSQLIHDHIPNMQMLHPVTSMYLITYRWTTTGHLENSRKEIMHRLPHLRDHWGRKHHSLTYFHCLLVYVLPQYVQTYAHLNVISGHMKEKLVIWNPQHGFIKVKSCMSNVIVPCHKMMGSVDEKISVVPPTWILASLNNVSHRSFHLM